MQKQSHQQLRFQALLGERAHFMRHNLTDNERILWRRISGKQLGVAFRRQVPIGGKYIADFVAPIGKLIVEVDDRSHELKRTADVRRDRNLARLGYTRVAVAGGHGARQCRTGRRSHRRRAVCRNLKRFGSNWSIAANWLRPAAERRSSCRHIGCTRSTDVPICVK
jgi:very-short-patch-repair endonuclease